MLVSPVTLLLTTLSSLFTLSSAAPACTASKRLAGAKQIPYAYNLIAPGASAAAFAEVPFALNCTTFINPNGGPAIPVAVDAATTRDFAITTRQVFSQVTGRYTDFTNGTTIIATNVTLGALHILAIPVTFSANVYLTYDLRSCQIYKVQAYATIPTEVLGVFINPPRLGLCG